MVAPVRLFAAIVVASLLSFAAASSAAADGNCVLVDDGVARAPIIMFQDAPPMIRGAADELADYVAYKKKNPDE